MACQPTTDQIVDALLTLGVRGPATAVDVLGAAGMVLDGGPLKAVLDGVIAARFVETATTEPRPWSGS